MLLALILWAGEEKRNGERKRLNLISEGTEKEEGKENFLFSPTLPSFSFLCLLETEGGGFSLLHGLLFEEAGTISLPSLSTH